MVSRISGQSSASKFPGLTLQILKVTMSGRRAMASRGYRQPNFDHFAQSFFAEGYFSRQLLGRGLEATTAHRIDEQATCTCVKLDCM